VAERASVRRIVRDRRLRVLFVQRKCSGVHKLWQGMYYMGNKAFSAGNSLEMYSHLGGTHYYVYLNVFEDYTNIAIKVFNVILLINYEIIVQYFNMPHVCYRGYTRELLGCAKTTLVDKLCSETIGPRSLRPV